MSLSRMPAVHDAFLRAPRRRMMKWPLLPPGRDTHYIALAFPHARLIRARTPPAHDYDYENETENSLSFLLESRSICSRELRNPNTFKN